MASILIPNIYTFEAAGAIARGKAVKLDSTGKIVTLAAATTDKVIGIAQNAAVNVGDLVEVACNGGGAKALAKTTIAAGDLLGVNSDGSIQKANAANDRVVGVAMQSAVAADIFSMQVALGMATQQQA